MGSGACFSLRKMLEGIRNTSAALHRSFFGCFSKATCRCTASCGNRCKWRSSFVSLLRSFRRSCPCGWKFFATTFQENEFSSFIGKGSITELRDQPELLRSGLPGSLSVGGDASMAFLRRLVHAKQHGQVEVLNAQPAERNSHRVTVGDTWRVADLHRILRRHCSVALAPPTLISTHQTMSTAKGARRLRGNPHAHPPAPACLLRADDGFDSQVLH